MKIFYGICVLVVTLAFNVNCVFAVATPQQYADTCEDADASAEWTVDIDSELDFVDTVDTSGYSNDYTPWLWGYGGCTGHTAKGAEIVIRINGGTVDKECLFTWTLDGDGSTYLVTDCDDPVNSCVAGADEYYIHGYIEEFTYIVEAGQTYYWILDAYGMAHAGLGVATITDLNPATPTQTSTPTITPTPAPTATQTPVPHSGDVDGDGAITPADAYLAVLLYLSMPAPDANPAAADFCPRPDGNGAVDPADAYGILREYAGFPDPC